MKRLLALFVTFLAISAITFANQVYIKMGWVSGDSMNPTLTDRQFITQLINWKSITKSNIVTAFVFEWRADKPIKVIKRVYGVPGDRIQYSLTNGNNHIFVNDSVVATNSGQYEIFRPGLSRVLKEHELFIMGDNHSETSMHIISTNQVIGKVITHFPQE